MNGTNKAAVGVVFGIALAYGALCFALTLMELLDGGPITLYLFTPLEDGYGFELSALPVISEITEYYAMLVDRLATDEMLRTVIVALGFVIAVIGMFTPWSIRVKGTDNPVEYLWTMRPGATVRGIFAPFGLIGTCWNRSKPLVIVPVILLPFYVIWAVMLVAFILVPFLIVKLVIGGKVRGAANRDNIMRTNNRICPKCKRDFDNPKVRCKCGLILDYPVPNMYGYKYHSCNNGDRVGCVRGKRNDLVTVCPYCDAVLDNREADHVSIALVGATGSGKTTMMLAAVRTITQVARTRDVAVDAITDGVSKQTVEAKDLVARTASGELDSECLYLRGRDMPEKAIVFNDISGTEFEPKEGKVMFQEYYRYSTGIVFAIDPFSIIRTGRGPKPQDVFDSFHSIYTQINGKSPSYRSDTPLAIVITKNDVMSPSLKNSDVRDFLMENDQAQFVRLVESLFSDVRYFAVNSKGDDCKSAADPIWWIVGKGDKELASKVPILSV